MDLRILFYISGLVYARAQVQATTTSEPWFCYVCYDCGDSFGTIEDCSDFTDTKFCVITKSLSTGIVSRSCGLQMLENLGLTDGCGTNQGTSYCICSENACNKYPDIVDTTTHALQSTQISTTTETPWYCYTCVDCAHSLGTLDICPGAKSCLVVTNTFYGTVMRACGAPAVDLILPQKEGCITASNGFRYCKCSTNICNSYIDDEPTTPLVLVPTTWHEFHQQPASGGSGSAERVARWLIVFVLVYLV